MTSSQLLFVIKTFLLLFKSERIRRRECGIVRGFAACLLAGTTPRREKTLGETCRVTLSSSSYLCCLYFFKEEKQKKNKKKRKESKKKNKKYQQKKKKNQKNKTNKKKKSE